MSDIRVWHAPEPTREPVIWRAPAPATDLVRDSVLERARETGQRLVERAITRLCPHGERAGNLTWRTGARLHVELAPVKEPEPDLLLHAYVKRRSFQKVPNGGRLKLTGKHAGAYRFDPTALGES